MNINEIARSMFFCFCWPWGVAPDNTVCSNAWARRNVKQWARSRSAANPSDAVAELLSLNDPYVVCKWLCKFMLETCQESGKPYPPKSLYSILCGLQCTSHSNGVRFNFLDKKDLYGLLSYTELLTLFLVIYTCKVLEHQRPLLLLYLLKMKMFFLMRKLCQWMTQLASRT